MRNYDKALLDCPLFSGVNEEDMRALLGCLGATARSYEKHSAIFHADDTPESVGVILSGSVHVIQEDYWGNRTILAHITSGGLFGEAFSCAEADKLPVSVFATEKSEIMLIRYRKIIASCSSACEFHTRLIGNMIRILAEKNILLTQKIAVTSGRTTRDKLLAYLSAQAIRAGSGRFRIPFNRQELADYLCVDRSALSRELSRMREEGVLEYDKSLFRLK